MGITNNKQKMTWLLAAVYIFILVWLILFKMAMPSEIPYLDHIRNINLIPFYYDNETSGHASEVIKNVILFIPLGLYLRIMGLSWRKAIVIGAALSAVLEILQYIFGVRYGLNKTNEYNLVPFVSEIDVVEHLLNVVLFVPFGLLMPFMYDKKSNFYQIIILGEGLSLLIEISQLLNHRVTDIDDLLLNSIGVVLGYGVFILLNRCIKSINSLNAISLTLICTLILSTFLGRFCYIMRWD